MDAQREWLDYHRRRDWLGRAGQASIPARYALAAVAPRAGGPTLSEQESKQVLARIGIPVSRDLRARSATEAAAAAARIGFPVAVKVDAAHIDRKSTRLNSSH